ncbi:hypothetical protein BGZ76_006727, partial [Entomortierella beljakovae]
RFVPDSDASVSVASVSVAHGALSWSKSAGVSHCIEVWILNRGDVKETNGYTGWPDDNGMVSGMDRSRFGLVELRGPTTIDMVARRF